MNTSRRDFGRQVLGLSSVWLGLGADTNWDTSGETIGHDALELSWDTSGTIVVPKADQKAIPHKRPVVTFFTADWCGPCQIEKSEIARHRSLPFDIKTVNCTNGGQPDWVPAFPTFWWTDHKGKPWQSRSFKAVLNDFMPQPVAKPTAIVHAAPSGAQWSWPGGTEASLRRHLREFHRVAVGSLGLDGLIAVHNQQHNG